MEYFIYMLKKSAQSTLLITLLIAALWGILYSLTTWETVACYLWIGAAVCVLNTLVYNWQQGRFTTLLSIRASWLIMAGIVLILYHLGFTTAAVFVAAAIFVSPLFWATICESLVGLSLLITLFSLRA